MKLKKEQTKVEDVYTEVGECQMNCQRRVIVTKSGSVIVCDGCMRIVIDNRNR